MGVIPGSGSGEGGWGLELEAMLVHSTELGGGGAREVLPLLLGANKNLWCRASDYNGCCLLSNPVQVNHPLLPNCTFQANLVVNSRELSFTTRNLSAPRSDGKTTWRSRGGWAGDAVMTGCSITMQKFLILLHCLHPPYPHSTTLGFILCT